MRTLFKTSYDDDINLFQDRRQLGWYALLLAVMIGLPWLLDVYLLGEVTNVLIFALAGLGLMLLVGQTGQASLGHGAFMAIGAYANILLQERLGLPFILSFPLAGIIAGLAGMLLALPTSRLHGIYLAIATLAVSIIFEDIIILAEPLTGGVAGLFAPDINLFGLEMNRYINPQHFYWLVLFVVVLAIILYRNILRTPTGRAFAAIRDSEISAKAMGINVAGTRIVSFGLSTMLTGLAGALMGHYAGIVTHETFNIMISITLLMMVVVGGLGSIHGAFFGAAVVAFLPQVLAFLRDGVGALIGVPSLVIPGLESAVFGLILVLFILFEPLGIYGLWLKTRTYFELFPFYRKDMFRRQKSYLKTERVR